MRILIVGAGAIGGYFGARLLDAGRDVTFLDRPQRAHALAARGLNVRSPAGDVHISAPKTVLAKDLKADFDLVILSCKAFDLDAAIADVAASVGMQTAILPLLNGMRHIEVLDQRFTDAVVLGGQCVISTTLDADGTIVHLNATQSLTYGARDDRGRDVMAALVPAFTGAGFDATASDAIMQAMWEKWVVLASMAGATCIMRAPIGLINRAAGGEAFILGVLGEVSAVATAAGHAPRSDFIEQTQAFLTDRETGQTSSMFRDIAGGARIEADHIIGDLLTRAEDAAITCPRLEVIYTHLKAYEAGRSTS